MGSPQTSGVKNAIIYETLLTKQHKSLFFPHFDDAEQRFHASCLRIIV